MKPNFSTAVDSCKYAITILVYTLTKDLPPSFQNPFFDGSVKVAVALLSGYVTVLLFNAFFGRPKVKLTWIIGNESPGSNRPELSRGRTGLYFRYEVTAESFVAKKILKWTKTMPLEARISFSPVENFRVTKQRYGRETSIKLGTLTTKFKNGLSHGHGIDGEISVGLKQQGSQSTKIDCKLSMHPSPSNGRTRKRDLLLSKFFTCDASIEGFILKGASDAGSYGRNDINKAVSR